MRAAPACIVSLALALSSAPATARPDRTSPARQAEKLYEARKFTEAAAAFEALAESQVKYLYFAGLAYEALGHDARAILHWEAVAGAEQVEDRLRDRARSRIERAKRRTTTLRVTVSPMSAATGTSARLVFRGSGERAPLVVPIERLADGVQLESGTWEVQLESASADHDDAVETVELRIEDAEKSVDLVLPAREPVVVMDQWQPAPPEREPVASLPPRRKPPLRPLALGAGIAGGALAVGGGLALGFGRAAAHACAYSTECKPFAVRAPLDGMMLGSLALGASAGFIVTSLTANARRGELRRRAWLGEVALGGALAAAGAGVATWSWFTRQKSRLDAEAFDRLDLHGYETEVYPAMLLLGTGAALLVGSLAGIGLERRRGKTSERYARKARIRSLAPLQLEF
ncbi:hypothetical protein [Nannocystis pusilla]|uniref:PEGA domain-containing protein n=1 Tax=Nannocystis pusilla TaxID=889268 RepID=A0ABS7TWX2_9BACT|nr:hypothetical protein [Nannocystis pusilla]MBZ5712714.1 hypothetical protein [Nannocystis pusilla]